MRDNFSYSSSWCRKAPLTLARPLMSQHANAVDISDVELFQGKLPVADMMSTAHSISAMEEEEERKEGAETAASTPSQHEGEDRGASKTSKDRQCPFCSQAFTSSSLGRHLDLYIKPKNPKPPDGVHDIAEIRKIRGGITRRQPRSGVRASTSDAGIRGDGEKDSSASVQGRATSWAEQQNSPMEPPIQRPKQDEQHQKVFNSAAWHATGVIPNLPPRSSSRNSDSETRTGQAQRIQEMRRIAPPVTANTRSERDNESIWKLQEAAEMGRITELALREVLGSLEAASKKNESFQLFDDVDFFSLSFPGLCLAILPAPSTLFSPTPFPSPESWTFTPPGRQQFEVLNRIVTKRLEVAYKEARSLYTDSVGFKHSAHVQGAYEHWEQSLSDAERAAAWNLELCRGYTTVNRSRQDYMAQLEASKNRVRHLEIEYDRLSRCQLPRDYLLHPPHTVPVTNSTLKEAKATPSGTTFAQMNYDPDVILKRWRETVKTTTRRNPPPPPSQSYGPDVYDESTQSRPVHSLSENMVINGAVYGVNGPIGPYSSNHEQIKRDRQAAVQMSGVEYETPPNPGQVIEDAGEPDADAERDGVPASSGYHLAPGSAQKFYGEAAFGPPGVGVLNTNGKRASSSDGGHVMNGSSRGPKVLKERHGEEDRSAHHEQSSHAQAAQVPQQAAKKKGNMFPGSWIFADTPI
nr:hypothetical protein CFP56_53625 [Quercus suber]